jgi:hypothetical protein
MDGAKIFTAAIIVGCLGWFFYDKSLKEEEATQHGGVAGVESCETVKARENAIGGTVPTQDERFLQACRLHVCGLSFMHGSTVVFSEDAPEITTVDSDKVLKDSLTASSSTSETKYQYSCNVAEEQLRGKGKLVVKPTSFVQQ